MLINLEAQSVYSSGDGKQNVPFNACVCVCVRFPGKKLSTGQIEPCIQFFLRMYTQNWPWQHLQIHTQIQVSVFIPWIL